MYEPRHLEDAKLCSDLAEPSTTKRLCVFDTITRGIPDLRIQTLYLLETTPYGLQSRDPFVDLQAPYSYS